MAYGTYTGSKYNREHTRDERKAALLEALKLLVPKGARLTMRGGRGVGTLSLTTTVANLPFPVINVDRVKFDTVGRGDPTDSQPRFYTEEAEALREKLSAEAELFNYDHGEPETDYSDRAFFFDAEFNHEQIGEEKALILSAASDQRREINSVLTEAIARYDSRRVAQPNLKALRLWQSPSEIAREIDRATDSKVGDLISALEAQLAKSEDWDSEAATKALMALVERRSKPPKNPTKVTAPKKPTEKQLEKRIERMYYLGGGSGFPINVLDIPKVFAAGKQAIADNPGIGDRDLGKAIADFVRTTLKATDYRTTPRIKPVDFKAAAPSATPAHQPKLAPTAAQAATQAETAGLSPAQKAWATRRAAAIAKAG